MIKRIFTTIFTIILTVVMVFANTVFLLPTEVSATSEHAVYFRNNDCFFMTPAEKWSGNARVNTSTKDWEVNVENGGSSNGHDIHMWKSGSNSKFRVSKLDSNNTFRIQVTKAKDNKDGRFWDVDDRSKDAGANIHVWSGRNSDEDDSSQRFYLIDNNDGDSETFYIKNLNSGKYLVPKDYFKNPKDNSNKKDNWDDKGRKLTQSNYSFRWRFHITSREAANSVDYFDTNDYFVMSPAEKWINGTRSKVDAAEWEVTAQNEGNTIGDDIQMYKHGISSKFRVRSIDSNNTFKIQITNFQEKREGKYWDVEGRNVSSGAIVHTWYGRDSNDDSQRFYLLEDNDGDPETFYIKNLNSEKYLVPRDYFVDPGSNCREKKNWDNNGCNIIQSWYAFRWRINVLTREVSGTQNSINWMSKISKFTYLSQLSIPGTHDACTANVQAADVAGQNNTACQKYFIDEQLIAGVRAFDLRTNENKGSNTFVMVHGNTKTVCHMPGRGSNNTINMKLTTVLNQLLSFIKKHPSETIIASVKIDGGNDKFVKRRLANLLLDKYITRRDESPYFYQWNKKKYEENNFHSPLLHEVRGKIVLLSRVNFSDANLSSRSKDTEEENKSAVPYNRRILLRSYTGPDISEWDNKYSDSKDYAQIISPDTSEVKIWVQDNWATVDSTKESYFFNTIAQINGDLQQEEDYSTVVQPGKDDFVFNYSSKTTGSKTGLNPLSGARYMNNLIFNDERFSDKNDRLGIVMMDYVNKALAARVIEHNDVYKYNSKTSSRGTSRGSTKSVKTMSSTVEQPELFSSNPDFETKTGLDTIGVSTTNVSTTGVCIDNTTSSDRYANETVKYISLAEKESKQLVGEHEIIWPTSATVTYGYILDEATLNFKDPNKQSSISGFYTFENSNDILTVSDDNEKEQTLIFESYDGTVKESRNIPVTVNPRPLPICVGNYQVEYGEKFDFSQASFPTAGGYLLASDQDKLYELIKNAGLHYKAVDEIGNDIAITTETRPCSGIIRLTADNPNEIKHPNYSTTIQDGVWKIIPRTVSVEWSQNANGWQATIDNLVNGDDVKAVVSQNPNGIGAKLTLSGEDANAYKVASEDKIPQDQSQNPEQTNSTLYIILLVLGVLTIAVIVFVLIKKNKTKK